MGQNKRVTLKDIAQRSGYTVNTVSRALHDKDDISGATKRKIRHIADDMGYVVDVLASSMRSGMTKTIAVIVGDIINPFFGSQVKNIEREAQKHDYNIIIFNSDENESRERQAILSAYSKRVDGILICPVQETQAFDNITLLGRIGIPFVLLGRYYQDVPADYVVWDDKKAGRIATEHLIAQGHRRILYIGGSKSISSGRERLEGYQSALKAAKLPADRALVRTTNVTAGACEKEVLRAINMRLDFTAIVAFSDLMAFEAARALKGRGGEYDGIPIVGFDNVQSALLLPVDLPSVRSIGDIADTAVDILMQKLHGERAETDRIQIVLDVTIDS